MAYMQHRLSGASEEEALLKGTTNKHIIIEVNEMFGETGNSMNMSLHIPAMHKP